MICANCSAEGRRSELGWKNRRCHECGGCEKCCECDEFDGEDYNGDTGGFDRDELGDDPEED